jgi:G3E family GTPase
VRNFDRLVIETTGLADPAPVIQALMTMPVVRRFRLAQVVTAVDAMQSVRTLAQHPESVKQAAVADDIVITKTDISGADVADVTAAIEALNPGARFHRSFPGRIVQPSDLSATDIYDPATKSADVLQWLNAEAYHQAERIAPGRHAQGDEHHGQHHHHHDVNRHNAEIGSFCLTFSDPLEWEHVANWLDALVIAHGDQLLRVKGILSIAGRPKPIVVQAVQRLFHPPFELPQWPDADQSSRIVFITRALSREFVVEVFETIRQRRVARAG